MKTKAVRLYGEKDLRLDEFELPKIKEDEILVKIISDSVCMSTYKLAQQGDRHTRVPGSLKDNPVVVGHEMSGIIIEVGKKWENKYKKGEKFTVQPDMNIGGEVRTAGYYYPMYGGDSTYSILPNEVMENDYLILFEGDSFFEASLAEPTACIVSGYQMMYHTTKDSHEHIMGVRRGGNQIVFGACGPMGLECLDYGLQLEDGPDLIVAVDVTEERLRRAEKVLGPRAEKKGKKIVFFNANNSEDIVEDLLSITDGHGYDDAFVYAPVRILIEQANKVLAKDGCLNFFAGPVDKELSATINFYNVHYAGAHIVGSSGSTLDDMIHALKMMEKNRIMPAVMVTHIGGLESAIDTTLNLPNIPGGKKLVYPHVDLPLTAIEDFKELAKENELFAKLAEVCENHSGCWNANAEKILLDYYNVDTAI